MDITDISIDTEFLHFVDIISDQPDCEGLMVVGIGNREELYEMSSVFINTIPEGRSRVCFCNIHRFNQHSFIKIIRLMIKYRDYETRAKLIEESYLRSEHNGHTVHGRLLAVKSPRTVSKLNYLCARALTQEQYEKLPQTKVFQERNFLKTKKIKWEIEQDIDMEDMDTCGCEE